MSEAQVEHVIETPGPVRSTNELDAYAARHPCVCGEPSVDGFEYVVGRLADGRDLALLRGACPGCGRRRRIRSWLFLDPPPSHKSFHLAAVAEPSFVIGPHEFLDEILPCDLTADPDTMLPDPYGDQYVKNAHALMAINELAKFLPEGASKVPDAAYTGPGWPDARATQPEQFTRRWIEQTRARLVELRQRYEANELRIQVLEGVQPKPCPPKPKPFTFASLDAHRLWTQAGGHGNGTRLEVAEYDATGVRLSAQILSGLIADHVVFDRADFSMADLDAAEFTGCSARDAAFGSTKMPGSTLVRCAFDRAHMTLTKLGDSTLIECSFNGARLDRSTWYRAQVRECSFRDAAFGNAAFDNAVFTDCDFRGADFSLLTEDLLGTIFDALFERCDLRGTKWARRSLHRGRFIDCKFGDSSGPPTSVSKIELINPDLTADGTGSPNATRDDLCRYWQMDMEKVRAEDDAIRAYWTKRFLADGDDPNTSEFEELIRNPRGNKPQNPPAEIEQSFRNLPRK